MNAPIFGGQMLFRGHCVITGPHRYRRWDCGNRLELHTKDVSDKRGTYIVTPAKRNKPLRFLPFLFPLETFPSFQKILSLCLHGPLTFFLLSIVLSLSLISSKWFHFCHVQHQFYIVKGQVTAAICEKPAAMKTASSLGLSSRLRLSSW